MSSSIALYIFQTRDPQGLWNLLIMLEWLITKLQYLTLSTVPGFLHESWDLNSGLVLA